MCGWLNYGGNCGRIANWNYGTSRGRIANWNYGASRGRIANWNYGASRGRIANWNCSGNGVRKLYRNWSDHQTGDRGFCKGGNWGGN